MKFSIISAILLATASTSFGQVQKTTLKDLKLGDSVVTNVNLRTKADRDYVDTNFREAADITVYGPLEFELKFTAYPVSLGKGIDADETYFQENLFTMGPYEDQGDVKGWILSDKKGAQIKIIDEENTDGVFPFTVNKKYKWSTSSSGTIDNNLVILLPMREQTEYQLLTTRPFNKVKLSPIDDSSTIGDIILNLQTLINILKNGENEL